MSATESKARLDKVMEYCIFSQTPITLFDEANPNERFQVFVLDIDDKFIKVRPTLKLCRDKLAVPERIQGLLSYKSQALGFETKLASITEEGDMLLSLPGYAFVSNQRKYPRMSVDEDDYEIRMDVLTQTGHLSFATVKIKNVSQKGIALDLLRKEGLLLPGDEVKSLKISRQGEVVFDRGGRILRVDREKTDTGFKEHYLAVYEILGNPREREVEANQGRRRVERVCLLEKLGSYVTFSHPMFPLITLTGQIADISTSGMSFLVDKTRFPIFNGLQVNGADVQLPFVAMEKCSFKIVHVQEVYDSETFHYRVGVHFVRMTQKLFKAIAELVQSNMSPNLIDANSTHYEDLWELFFESGFIYREKRRHLQQFASKVFNTYLRLLNSKTPILKKILFREGEELRGHVSAVKFFDNSWIVQHLNSSKSSGVSPAQTVLDGMIKFFLDSKANSMTGSSFICFYYRPTNAYPAILFGHVRDFINDRSVCDFWDMDYCLPKEFQHLEGSRETVFESEIAVSEAETDELHDLENILVNQRYFSLIRVENLTVEGLINVQTQAEFDKLGLYRFRRVFVAKVGEKRAYAVSNYASPGINLSELTNSFRIFFSHPGAKENQLIADALAAKVIGTYKNTDMPYGTYLVECGGVIPSQYAKAKIYRYWFMEAKAMPHFRDATQEVFHNFKAFLDEFKKRQAEENDGGVRATAI